MTVLLSAFSLRVASGAAALNLLDPQFLQAPLDIVGNVVLALSWVSLRGWWATS